MTTIEERLTDAYRTLLAAFGPQDWWPALSRFEMMVGAVLTQNTSWTNAERAIENLRGEGALEPAGLAALSAVRLEELIRPAGFCRRKARTLTDLLATIVRSRGGLDGLLDLPQDDLRQALLRTTGIGPETADAIVLYAGGHPTFVVDAYTRRFAARHGLASERASYDEVQRLFEDALPRRTDVLNEYHALLVCLGKRFCRPVPLCEECPLRSDLPGPV
jgi:endonuclease-3 related protein